jgi:hypothetical protein
MSPDPHEANLLVADERRVWNFRKLALILVLASPVVLLLGTVAVNSFIERSNRIPFDSDAWKRSLIEDPTGTIRQRMVDDLLARHQLRGKTREEIIKLLGETQHHMYFANYKWPYYLGPARGAFSVGLEWLGLQFDDDGRVADVRVLQRNG